MTNLHTFRWAVVLFVIVAKPMMTGFQGQRGPHAVSGAVTDSAGSAVTSALVAAIPAEEGANAGDFGWVHVDDQGKFRLVLTPGRYVLRAKAEADGYPDPSFLLSSDPSAIFPDISVNSSDVSDVRVVLGRRGGILAGDLRNASTQRTVSSGRVTIRDARHHGIFVEVSVNNGHFQFTVPSKPVEVSATAPGYLVTPYDTGKEVLLSGGEHRNLIIDLTPK